LDTSHEPTDGVEFVADAESADGSIRTLFRRTLDPANIPADRGLQSAVLASRPHPGETIVFRTRPNNGAAFDWAFWKRIEIK